MRRHIVFATVMAGIGVGADAHAATPPTGCLPQVVVPMLVAIGESPPQPARLQGGFEIPLQLFDAQSGRMLWSAGPQDTAVQTFAAMDAGFTGSLTAIDLDADGLHDRIYAGDMAGRLWRLDLHHGAAATTWVTGGVLADFSNSEGRGFLAAPDISLADGTAPATWLNIAIGTAAPGNPDASNRFYVLRDHAVSGMWTEEQWRRWHPLREADLTRIDTATQLAPDLPPDIAAAGWYVELGAGHVIAPALTTAHRTVIAIAAAVPRPGACEVFTHVASFDLALPRIAVIDPATGAWRRPLAAPVSASATFTLQPSSGGDFHCMLDGQRIDACDVDTRPRRTWWRRTDAE